MSDQPPATLRVQVQGIPDALRELPQWVCWAWEQRGEKWTKPPVSPRTGYHASSTDARTWHTLGAALRYAGQNRLPGVGFVVTFAAGIVAVDLDACVQDGTIAPWAQAIIARFASYTELSPSGTGVHIFAAGQLGTKGRRQGRREIYQAERYVTVTGHRIDGTPATVEPAQAAIDWMLAALGGAQETVAPPAWTAGNLGGDLRSRAEQARIRRDTLALLDNTGPGNYASASEADSAIACALVGAGFSPEDALCLLRESVRGSDIPRRKGKHAESYMRRTVEHAAAFAIPQEICGIPVQRSNGARALRGLSTGSQYSQIHDKNEFQEENGGCAAVHNNRG